MIFLLISSGLVAGVFSGLFGIGGGIVLVPSLTYLLGFSPKTASGTSLVAMILPVGILGVLQYYRSGIISNEHLKFGLWLALGMFVGAFMGAKLGVFLPVKLLQKLFSILMIFAAVRIWIQSNA